jgi:hypothetical protein
MSTSDHRLLVSQAGSWMTSNESGFGDVLFVSNKWPPLLLAVVLALASRRGVTIRSACGTNCESAHPRRAKVEIHRSLLSCGSHETVNWDM